MTVVDASALVAAFLAGDERAETVEHALGTDALAAPGAMRAEFLSALRNQERSGRIEKSLINQALAQCAALPITLHPVEPYLGRMWELRNNVTPYDAWYVALAETLGARLLTTDARLAGAPGIRCDVWLV